MYYIEKDEKIVAYNESLTDLQAAIEFKPELAELEIKETARPIVDFEFTDTPEYKAMELNKLKKIKLAENEKIRDEALIAGVTYRGVLFDSDTDQKVNLLGAVRKISDEDTITWYGMNNEPLECTKEDLFNIGDLITELNNFCWTKNAQIEAAINKAKTLTALKKVVIDYENNTDFNE